MKLRTLALSAAIGLSAVAATQAQDVAGRSLILRGLNVATPANVGTLTVTTLTGARTYTLPDASGTVLLSSGGTLNQLTRFGAGGAIVDGSLSDNGTGTLTRAGNIAINPGAAFVLSTNGSFTVDGSTNLGDADADVTTLRGTVNLNTTNTAGATVNISTSAQANTTNIGSSTLNNVTNITGNAAGAAVTIVNANGAAGTGLAITDAFTNGLTLGTTTPPVTGIRVNSTATGIVVNSGAGTDLTINEDALTRNGNIAVNPGAANTVSTNGHLQVDGNTTLGSAGTNTTTINGRVHGAATNRFADRVDISALDGDGLLTIANTAVRTGAVIVCTVESPAADATVYTLKVQNVVNATSFDVQFAGGALAAAANRFLSYIIINP